MYVDPTNITTSTTFTVSINVTNVVDLYAWEFQLNYTTSILSTTAANVVDGGFLKNGPYSVPYLWVSDDDDSIYQLNYSNPAATPISSFTGSGRPYGVEYVNGNIYTVDYSTDTLYNYTLAGGAGTPASWGISGYSGNAYGLGWNGTHFFVADRGADLIYIVDPADPTTSVGAVTYTGIGYVEGVTFDGTYLWASDTGTDTIYQIDYNNNTITSWSAPASDPTGISWDGKYIWVLDNGADTVYKCDTSGTQVASYAAPSGWNGAEGLTFGYDLVTPGSPRSTYYVLPESVNDAYGRVWVTSTLLGNVPGVAGSGILANITFTIDGSGTSPLDLHDTYLVGRNFVNQSTYYITHSVVDGSVTVPSAPEFPFGAAMEIGVAAVIVYVWWKRKTEVKPQMAP